MAFDCREVCTTYNTTQEKSKLSVTWSRCAMQEVAFEGNPLTPVFDTSCPGNEHGTVEYGCMDIDPIDRRLKYSFCCKFTNADFDNSTP